jgi:VWFA-related protein
MKLTAVKSGVLMVALAGAALAQTTLHTTTTLVVVPTLVETQDKQVVFSLTADDFVVTDNGVPQRVTLEEERQRPMSLVVLVQTGGAARGQFANYDHLETMLAEVVGKGRNRVSIVNFDSRPEAASAFTTDIAQWRDAINHPDTGDSGAAIFDGIAYGLQLLKKEPAGNRRAILLISQEHDVGSTTSLKEIVRDLGETNTAVYSVTFSAEKTAIQQALKAPAHINPPITLNNSPTTIQAVNDPGATFQGYFNLDLPLALVLGSMRKNLSAEVARLSGGEASSFGSRGELDEALGRLSSHIRNSYLLSFSPTSTEPGLHALKVRLARHPEMTVFARGNYWAREPEGSATNH